jgi:uncharacterized protein YdcH (DUF465 family)
MTPEEVDKNIEFILQMQAQFSSNLVRSQANIDNLRASGSELRHLVADLAVIVGESAKLSDDRFVRMDDRFARLDDRILKLTDAQAATDRTMKELAERLNALINVMEQHITGPDHGARP